MKLIKNKIATLSLPLCVLFSQTTLANISPYIGYEHSFSRESMWSQDIVRYTPRFYFGVRPISMNNYQFGIEGGYFLPYSYEYTNYDFGTEHSVKNHRSDLYVTVYKPLGDHVHLFLKPGMEFLLKNFDNQNTYIIYHPIIKGGIGYTFNNKVSVNFITGSRFDSVINSHYKGNMLFTFDVNYKW